MIDGHPCCDNCPHYDAEAEVCAARTPLPGESYPPTGNANLCGDHPWLECEVSRLTEYGSSDLRGSFESYIKAVRDLRQFICRGDDEVLVREVVVVQEQPTWQFRRSE